MTKEGKIITKAVLTICVYGLTSFLTFGQSIFPFPLNEIIFLIVSIYFATLHLKKNPYTVTVILLSSLLSLLSSEFYWEIVLNTKQMTYISENNIPLKFGLSYNLFLTIWMFLTFSPIESIKIKLLGIITILLQIVGFYFDLPIYSLLSLALLFIYSILYVQQNPLLYLWILLFILDCTKLWHLTSLH